MNIFSGARTCVVPAAGRAIRLRPLSDPTPKPLVMINDKPLIFYVFNKIKELGVNHVVMIINYHRDQIIRFLGKNYVGVEIEFVVQEKLDGIANAVKLAEPYVGKEFFVMLGDEVYDTDHSEFSEFVKKENPDCSFCMMKTKNESLIRSNYSVEIEHGKLIKLVEKPKVIVNPYFGVGTYFFKRKVFDFVDNTPFSRVDNERNLTDVMQAMIDSNYKVTPFFLEGRYVNVNSIEDLEKAIPIVNQSDHHGFGSRTCIIPKIHQREA